MGHRRFRSTPRCLVPAALLLLLILPSGCAYHLEEGGKAVILASSEAFKNFTGEYENTGYFQKHRPKRIAVLPFQNLAHKAYSIDYESDDPAGIVRRGLYNHISSLPFEDVELYRVDRLIQNAGVTDTRQLDALIAENPKKLQSILGADAAVTGVVTHFDRIFAGIYSQVAVGCEVSMWDLKTGQLLWRAQHVSRAHAGGFSLSPVGLAMATVASVWNLRGTELLSQTDELFREIVSTMDVPETALAGRTPPPRIDLFAAVNADRPFTLGQQAAFRIIGDPGCSAYVDLGDFQSGIELAPVTPAVKQALRADVLAAIQDNYEQTGHRLTPELMAAVERELDSREVYEGSYTVEADQEAYGLTPKAYLVNEAGVQATTIDAAHFVDVDSRPPAATADVVSAPLDGKVKVRWRANGEADLARYELWRSRTPLSGFQEAARTETSEVLLTDQPNFEKFYVRVRALDRAGNAGAFSATAEAVALPTPDLYSLPRPGPMLSGVLTGRVLLVAEKSPFSVMGDLTVAEGAVLYLEPGVVLKFAPDVSLQVIRGDLFAYGSPEKPVRFSARSAAGGPGAWKGVVVDGGRQVMLRHVQIEGARTGIHIANSAPTLHSTRVSNCAQAGLVLDSGAKPDITCSVFEHNQGQGGVVIQGEGLAPQIRFNEFVDNSPFQVQSYTPLQIDLTENYWGDTAPRTDWFLGNIQWRPALDQPPERCGTPAAQ
jgi:hypothetical protein